MLLQMKMLLRKYKLGKFFLSIPFLISLFVMTPWNVNAASVRIHCDEDTLKVGEILRAAAKKGGSFGDRCAFAARQLAGTAVGTASDNDSIGTLMVNLHTVDRLGFINNVMAMAQASLRNNPTFDDYLTYLERYSRKKGIDEGFASQFHYGADWIVDNVYRGNLKEMTEYLPGGGFKVKTLDYVSRHADQYPALADSLTFDKIKMMEMGYRSHRIPHLKKQSIGNKEMNELVENGDIIMMLSNDIDRDIYDVGIVEMRDGQPYLIHPNSEKGEIAVDPYPLARLFKLENQHFYGYRWLRPKD